MAIVLPDETTRELTEAIKGYFRDERGEEIGDLQASFFLAFVLEAVGPSVYNQAIRDAQASLQHVVAELGGTLYEPELAHTAARRPPGRTRAGGIR